MGLISQLPAKSWLSCLAADLEDLKARLARIVVGYTFDRQPVTAGDLKAEGALALLLKDAIKPNLVQTIYGTPALSTGDRLPISLMAAIVF